MTTTAAFTGGPGTFTILDDTPAAILAFQTVWAASDTTKAAYLVANWSPVGALVTNTPIATMCSMASSQSSIATYLKNIDSKTGTINSSIQQLTEAVQALTTGAAAIQGTMSRQLVTQQLTFLDQQRNNKFQQLATNAARVEGGKSEIVVTNAEFDKTLKANLLDIGTLNSQVASTSYILNTITETGSDAIKTASTWFLTTKVGGALKGAYVDAKAKVASFFPKEEAAAAIAEGKQLTNEIRVKP
jgi:hypothetical protein